MGEVYEGIDKRLNRRVALKFLSADLLAREDSVKRFHREAAAIAAMQHPNIAVLYEFGDWAGQPFLAMEYLPGGSLREQIHGRPPLPFDSVLRYAVQIGRGLAYAHRKGIVHRDIKPSNVLLTEEGDVKIVDFGLATLAGGEDLTRTGTQVGTICYMAPELLQGAEPTPLSDQFSLGVSVYEIATGTAPFGGDNAAAMVARVLHATPTPVDLRRVGFPADFSDSVARAMAKNPADRFESVDVLTEKLEQLLSGSANPTVVLGMSTTAPVTARPVRRSRKLMAAAAALAAGLIGAALIPAIREPIRSRIAGPPAAVQKSVMVLPLENIGADGANAAFCEGLTETLSSLLSQMEGSRDNLLVIPASEARRSLIGSAREAARAFNVGYAITGSVAREPGSVRIILNLVDAKTLRQVNSVVRNAELRNAADLPEALAADLATLLNVSRADSGVPLGTKASAAWDLYTQGSGLLEERKLDEALEPLKRVVDLDPTFSDGHAALARCYFYIYDTRHDAAALAMADAESDRALAGRPGSSAHRVAGLIRQATGRYDDAIEEFGKMIALDARNVEGYRLRAIAFERSGRMAEAENEYLTAVRFKPGYWRTYSNLGAFYKSRGQYDKAVESLKMVTQLAPENAFGYRNLGGLYHLMGRTGEAASALRRSVELQPTAEGFSNVGTVLYFQKRYAEAATYYQKAIQLSARNPRLYGNLGDALLQLPQRAPEARDAFSRAADLAGESLETNPNDPALRASLSLYLVRLGRAAEAKRQIAGALAAAPENVDILFSSARVYELAGDRNRALKTVGEALRRGFARGEIDTDPDLSGLRADPRYRDYASALPQTNRSKK